MEVIHALHLQQINAPLRSHFRDFLHPCISGSSSKIHSSKSNRFIVPADAHQKWFLSPTSRLDTPLSPAPAHALVSENDLSDDKCCIQVLLFLVK